MNTIPRKTIWLAISQLYLYGNKSCENLRHYLAAGVHLRCYAAKIEKNDIDPYQEERLRISIKMLSDPLGDVSSDEEIALFLMGLPIYWKVGLHDIRNHAVHRTEALRFLEEWAGLLRDPHPEETEPMKDLLESLEEIIRFINPPARKFRRIPVSVAKRHPAEAESQE